MTTTTQKLDINNQPIQLPAIGTKVLRDGYTFSVTEVLPDDDIHIVASITLRGESGEVEVGYYNFLQHEPVENATDEMGDSPDPDTTEYTGGPF